MKIKQAIILCLAAVIIPGAGRAFGAPNQYTISGYVRTSEGAGVSGVNVIGSNGASSTVSAADGSYSVIVPNNWSGTITASFAGYGFTAKSYTNVTTDQVNQNFTSFQPTISGVITSYGVALDGVTLTATNNGGTAVKIEFLILGFIFGIRPL